MVFLAFLTTTAVTLQGIHAFSTATDRRVGLPRRSGKASSVVEAAAAAAGSGRKDGIAESETTEPKFPSSSSSRIDDKAAVDDPRRQSDRRRFVSQILSSTAGLLAASAASGAARADGIPPPPAADAASTARIVRLSSGLQFSDKRVGSGPPVQGTASSDDNNTNNGKTDEDPEPDDPSVVLMHLRALRRDGSVLLDTLEDGKPLLFRLGSVPSEMYYLNEAGAVAKGKIPLGVQDAILAQGAASWEGGFGKADPMRTGGIRKVVVPPELAYGSKGVSRYEAFQVGLREPVARNEILRYEITLLRCNDELLDLAAAAAGGTGDGVELRKDDGSAVTPTAPKATAARACCLQEFYPCRMTGSARQ